MTKPWLPTGQQSRPGTLLGRHRGLVGGAAALGATALAVTWTLVVPEKAGDAGPVQAVLLRYAHPVCWALLAIAAAAWALRAPLTAVRWTAWAALLAYLAFLTALVL